MTAPVTRPRICKAKFCSGSAYWDYEPHGEWYCDRHIAELVFSKVANEGRLAEYCVKRVTEQEGTNETRN